MYNKVDSVTGRQKHTVTFLVKEQWLDDIQQYMDDRQMSFLGVMFASTDNTNQENSKLKRQLLLCTKRDFPIDDLVSYLQNDGSLQLVQVYDDDSL